MLLVVPSTDGIGTVSNTWPGPTFADNMTVEGIAAINTDYGITFCDDKVRECNSYPVIQ